MTAESCSQCGWARRNLTAHEAVVALRSIAADYENAIASLCTLDAAATVVRQRPSPEVWSIGEYLAHTADAMEHIGRRVHLLLAEDDPELPRFGDPNSRDYADADIHQSVARIATACADLAAVFSSASPTELERRGHNALGTASLLDTASYAVHEAGHHLHDIKLISQAHMSA